MESSSSSTNHHHHGEEEDDDDDKRPAQAPVAAAIGEFFGLGTDIWWTKYCDDKDAVLSYTKRILDVCHQFKDSMDKFTNDFHTVTPAEIRNHYTFPLNKVSERLRDDDDVVVESIRCTASYIHNYHKQLCDIEPTLSAPTLSPLKYASQRIRRDKTIVLQHITAFRDNQWAIRWEPDCFEDDRDIIIALIQNTTSTLPYNSKLSFSPLELASTRLKNDKEVVLQAIQNTYRDEPYKPSLNSPLQYSTDWVRQDPDVVLQAIEANKAAIQWAADGLKVNKEFILRVLDNQTPINNTGPIHNDDDHKERHSIILYLPESIRDDFTVVQKFVSCDGYRLENASDQLRQDREIVLAAVKQAPVAIKFALGSTIDDEDIMLAATRREYDDTMYTICGKLEEEKSRLKYASERLKDDKHFILTVMHYKGEEYPFISARLKEDWQIIVTAVASSHGAWLSLSNELQKNKELALVCLDNHCPMTNVVPFPEYRPLLQSIGFQNDREIFETAIRKQWESIQYASCDLQLDPKLILLTIDTMDNMSDVDELRFSHEGEGENSDYNKVFSSLFGLLNDLNRTLLGQNDRLIDVLVKTPFPRKKQQTVESSCKSNDDEPEPKRLKRIPVIDVDQWHKSQWERVWLIGKVHTSFVDKKKTVANDIQRKIVEYCGFDKTIPLYGDLKKCEPILNRLNDLGLVRNRSEFEGTHELYRRGRPLYTEFKD